MQSKGNSCITEKLTLRWPKKNPVLAVLSFGSIRLLSLFRPMPRGPSLQIEQMHIFQRDVTFLTLIALKKKNPLK